MTVRILVVEDEPVVAMDLKQRLLDRGYQVIGVVATADAAVAAAAEQHPDLILMDIMLSGRADGIDAAERIRVHSEVPIVYLTAYADDATIERAKRTDASGYVVKPFRDRELHATLQVALQRHDHERSAEHQLRRVARALGEVRGATISVDNDGRVTWSQAPGASEAESRAALERLTKRERGVVEQLLAGNSIDRVAVDLEISRHTVRNHLKAIFRKLGVHSQVELVRKYQNVESPATDE